MPIEIINGTRMYFIEKGNGTAIIFVHPPLLNSINFIYQVSELSIRFNTIAYDIRGHGRSEPSTVKLTYSLLVEDIKQLMDHLAIQKAYICGYSTGGSIALEFLLTYPDRSLGAIVIGGMSEVHDLSLKSKIFLGMILAKWDALSLLAFSVSWSNADTPKLFWDMYRLAKMGDHHNIEQYYQFSMHYTCSSQLSSIKHPVLLVYGMKDKGFHTYANLLHTQLPNNKIVFINKMKHQIPTKANDELNDLIKNFIISQTTSM